MADQPRKIDRLQAQRLMSLALDGELSSEQAKILDRYLQDHPEEMAWMESQQVLADSLAPSREPGNIDATLQAVRESIDASSRQGSKVVSFPVILRGLSIAAAVALLGAFVWSRFSTPEKDPSLVAAASNDSVIEFVDTDIPHASPIAYQDSESGWNIVWVENLASLPDETS